jgi:hypothetical protein
MDLAPQELYDLKVHIVKIIDVSSLSYQQAAEKIENTLNEQYANSYVLKEFMIHRPADLPEDAKLKVAAELSNNCAVKSYLCVFKHKNL